MHPRLLAAAAAAAAALAGPASAHAAVVSVDKGCYAGGDTVTVTGGGFTPNAAVAIGGDVQAATTADAQGAFIVRVAAPAVHTATPKSFTVTATDMSAPALVATAPLLVVRAQFWTNAPISGRPSERVTWRFAGFTAGEEVYGHLRYHGRTVATHRFGAPSGPCGVLTARARRVPTTHLHSGHWQLKIDQSRRYVRTAPGRLITFTISDG